MRYRFLIATIVLLSITTLVTIMVSASNRSDKKGTSNHDNLPSELADFRKVEIPLLPFEDNPDPNECGIPQPWGANNNLAHLSGFYEGELIQPIVYLYDSHGRNAITAAAKHGTAVEVVMFQANPVLNYYFVRIPSAPAGTREGWVPAPFLSFDPVPGESP